MTYLTLTLTRSDGVAVLTLNRPSAARTINDVPAREFMRAVIECDDADDINHELPDVSRALKRACR